MSKGNKKQEVKTQTSDSFMTRMTNLYNEKQKVINIILIAAIAVVVLLIGYFIDRKSVV